MNSSLLPLVLLGSGLAASGLGAAERINHAGRILGPLPVVTAPTLFNTAAADAIVGAMQIMPRDNPWNEDVSSRPLASNSAAMIAMIRSDLATANRQRLVVFKEMNYVLVPDAQPLTDIDFVDYPDESDDLKAGSDHIGSWPIPGILPVETWPSEQPGLSNHDWQIDVNGDGGDRHSITVRPGAGYCWETWGTYLTTGTPAWVASNGAKFNLATGALRPAGWTSGDAAGLPMFPALVRYDEVQRGAIEHAMRIVVKRSRQACIYPATHQAGSTTLANVPAMGQRMRLRSTFAIPASWTAQERAIAVALKRYGALVADNGGFFSISICPDDRWPSGCFNHFATGAGSDYLDISNFEVVLATGPGEGPRSPGAPTANAGADQGVTLASGASLAGGATGSGLTTRWSAYPGAPGTVSFGNADALGTTAAFSAVGTYILMLTASDGVHTPAYDAVVISVAAGSNPAPSLDAISPTSATQNSGGFTLTLQGAGFVPASVVQWSGHADLATATATATQLTVAVPAAYLASPGTPGISVANPAPGGGASPSRTFTITADLTPPTISAIAAGSLGASAATITWTTDEAADSQVEYGATTGYGSTTTQSATLVTGHSVALAGLAAATTCHFRVRSRDAAGNLAISADGTFTTTSGDAGGTTSGGGTGGGCGGGGAAIVLTLLLGSALRRRLP